MASYRYFRVYATLFNLGTTEQYITEIKMKATLTGANLATGGSITQSGQKSPEGLAVNAFDGSTSTAWTNPGAGQNWVQYDFGVATTINYINIGCYPNLSTGAWCTETNAPCGFALYGSADNVTWVLLNSFSGQVNWTANPDRCFPTGYSVGTGVGVTETDPTATTAPVVTPTADPFPNTMYPLFGATLPLVPLLNSQGYPLYEDPIVVMPPFSIPPMNPEVVAGNAGGGALGTTRPDYGQLFPRGQG